MLYKGTEHGFKSNEFHARCDLQGPTICFVLSEFGYVFGGYVSINWENKVQINAD